MKRLIILLTLLLCGWAQAVTYTNVSNPPGIVLLAWDLSPDMAVTNYYVYWGTASRTYTNRIASGGTNYALITNLVRGTTYYFAATAVARGDYTLLESLFSNEATYTPALPPAPPTLRITNRLVTVSVQSAPAINGPWTQYATLGTSVEAPAFFRSVVSISSPAEPTIVRPVFLSPKKKAG